MRQVSRLLVALWAATSLTCTADAAATSSSNCSTPTHFFTQFIEHETSSSKATFQQQYQIVADHFKPGGPILYYQQAETSLFACMEWTILPEWAAELGALVITLEHRFFGLSDPSNASDPVEKYQSLTLENVMLDAVNFISHVKNTTAGAKDSKVLVMGGSYGGFLTTVLKMNHPDVFYGALPFAAPLRSIGANYQNPQRYNWFIWLNQVYWDLSASAAGKMKHAFEVLGKRIQAATDTESIAKDFGLCSVPNTTADLQEVMGVINTVQYQIPQLGFVNPIANPTGANVEKLVNQTLLLDDPVKIINASLNMWYPSSLYPCVPWGNGESVNPTLQLDSFNYLLCKYFPLSVNEVPDGTIFVPTSVQTESDPQTCMTKYNITPSTQDRVETQYHITRDELVNAKRILFAYNEFDPTTAVGIKPLPLTQDRNASRYMFTTLSSHGEESLASYPGDRPTVVHARNLQLQTFKEWLGMY
ncbi:hypothetical protein LTR92_001125 [Exophiala xenobiotica]|nr:hypothetical protein LTR92_001125 [Exophiala xenobiotica]